MCHCVTTSIVFTTYLVLNLTLDSNFCWADAGAMLFGSAAASAPKKDGDDQGSDEEEEDPNNVDIHFEPIVSLPEVVQ